MKRAVINSNSMLIKWEKNDGRIFNGILRSVGDISSIEVQRLTVVIDLAMICLIINFAEKNSIAESEYRH